MKRVAGGITRPEGFFASAIWCGIKKRKPDLCLIFSQTPARAAGVFTKNRMKAAPVLLSQKAIKGATAQAIIANSGNANCLTGKEGLADAEKIVKAASSALAIKKSHVLIASTGVIGRRMPVSKVVASIDRLTSSLSSDGSAKAAESFMTTDTVAKEVSVALTIGGRDINIGAIAKGAGMIHPDMATMLCFITTDAAISSRALKKALKESVDDSFNRITVDGDMSTNDCVFVLANGAAKNSVIGPSGDSYRSFKKALSYVCSEMAKMIVRDAEGATKFVTVNIKGAASAADAKKAAYAVATSLLVKTAIHGQDPNWGRIAAAIGRSGAGCDEKRLGIYLDGRRVFYGGRPRKTYGKVFRNREVDITVALNKGKSGWRVYTNDISKKYIDINAHYTT